MIRTLTAVAFVAGTLCTTAMAADEFDFGPNEWKTFNYWKKEGVNLSTDAGCKNVLMLIEYNAKKVGRVTALLDYMDMARAIRGKTEGCRKVRLGVSMAGHALDASSPAAGNLVSGYQHLREAAAIYTIDVSTAVPKL